MVFVLCAAGCLRSPEFKGRHDAAPDAELDAPDGGNDPCSTSVNAVIGGSDLGATACGPGYQVLFSETGAKMPYQLVVGGSQLLGSGRDCNDERLAGVGVYPMRVINALGGAGIGGTVAVTMPGPVVAKVTVDWSADYACTGSATMQDSTTYTFFPDGHIVRWDHLRQSSMVEHMNCQPCPGGGIAAGFFVTSFTTLVAPVGNSDLSGTAIDGLVTYGQQANMLSETCLTTLGQKVAFGWRNTGSRIRVVNTDTVRTLAFVHDILGGTQVGPDFADEVTTHMIVATAANQVTCSDLRTRAAALAARPGLTIQAQNLGPANDGIYGGTDDSGETGYMTQVGDVTLTPSTSPIPSGFAVWIDFGAQANSNVTFSHTGGTPSGDWVLQQRVSASEIIFYFRDALPFGQTITIHPG